MLPLASANGMHEHYRYANEGIRVQKFIRQSGKPTLQQARYLPQLELRAGQLQIVTLPEVRILRRSTHQVRFSISDRCESVWLELDQQAQIFSDEGYYPFGGTAHWLTRSLAATGDKIRSYSGKERDVSGLIFYGFRYYVPWLMRWLNPDPAKTIDGLNLWRMVRNNPLTRWDLDGCVSTAERIRRLLDERAKLALASDVGKDPAELEKEILKEMDQQDNYKDIEEKMKSGELTLSRPFVCTIDNCGMRFNKISTLHKHRKTHSTLKPFKCHEPDCKSAFLRNCDLVRHHKDTHIGARLYKCDHCNQAFKTRQHLDMHTTIHVPQVHLCPLEGCDKEFTNTKQLDYHLKVRHLEVPGNFACDWPECKQHFRSHRTLTDHLNMHAGIKNYQCTLCGIYVGYGASLYNHKRSQHGIQSNKRKPSHLHQ